MSVKVPEHKINLRLSIIFTWFILKWKLARAINNNNAIRVRFFTIFTIIARACISSYIKINAELNWLRNVETVNGRKLAVWCLFLDAPLLSSRSKASSWKTESSSRISGKKLHYNSSRLPAANDPRLAPGEEIPSFSVSLSVPLSLLATTSSFLPTS